MGGAGHGITSTEQGLTCPFPHTHAPQNVLRDRFFQSLTTIPCFEALTRTTVMVPFLLWQQWDPNLVDRGERKDKSPKLQARCDANQDLGGEFMNQSFSCSDQRVQQIGWWFPLCFPSLTMTCRLSCTFLFLFFPFYLSSWVFFLWMWQIYRVLSFYFFR